MKKIATILLSIVASCSIYAANKVVGDYGGSMSVSPTGAATYTIPIECPKGVNGMEPSVALVYNSQGGIGTAGKGWNLSATSVITKVNAVPFYDNKLLPLNYDKSGDYLMLDGQRLIKFKTISSAEVEFRTENDNYNRIIRKGSDGNFYFEVYTTSGIKMTYQQQPEGSSYYNGNLGWYLTQVEDQNGNYMTYEYNVISNNGNVSTVLLKAIRYGANSQQRTSHTQKIEFSYDASLPSPIEYYSAGYSKIIYQILSEIRTYAGTSTLNTKYKLTYKTDSKEKRILTSVKKYGNNGDYLDDVKIEWNDPADKLVEESNEATNIDFKRMFHNDDLDAIPDYQWFLCDYNQDGYPDLVSYRMLYIDKGLISCSVPYFYLYKNEYNTKTKQNKFTYEKGCNTELKLNTYQNEISRYGTSFSCYFTKKTQPNICYTQLSNDEKNLIIFDIENIDKDEQISIPLNVKQISVPLCSSADLNSDGFADIVIVERSGSNGSYWVKILWGGNYGKLAKYDSNKTTSFSFSASGEMEMMVVNDMDKDGLIDIVIVSNKGYLILKNNGNANGYSTISFSSLGFKTDMYYNPNERFTFISGDFNGDGILDFFKGGDMTNTIYWGKGTCTFKNESISTIQSCPKNAFAFGADIDGDGKMEVAIVKNGGKNIYWYRFNGIIFTLYNSSYSENRKLTQREMLANDLNGDGRSEIVTIGASNIGVGYGDNTVYITKQSADNNAGLIKNISTPTRTYSINYSNLYDSNVYKKDLTISEAFNLMSLKLPINVVKTLTEEKKGQSMELTNYYRYENLVAQTTGKGLLGFKMTEARHENSTTDIVTKTYNSIDYSKAILYPSYTDVLTNKGDSISRELYTYNKSTFGTNSKGVRLLLTKKETLDCLNNTTYTTTYTYSSNSNGNPTTITVDKGDNVKSKTTFSDLVSNSIYNVFLPQTKAQSQSSANRSISRISRYTYDSKLQLTKSIDFYNTEKNFTTTYAYDNNGNLAQEEVSASECETKTTNYDYDVTGRFCNKIVTSNGSTTIYDWNTDLGRVTKKTESIGSLSYVTTYDSFDGFNNCLKSTLPDGRVSTKTISYVNTFDPCFYQVKTTLTGSPDVIEVYDSDGRKIRITTTYADGIIRSNFKDYDNAGFLLHDFLPVKGNGRPSDKYFVRNTYDDFGRIKKEERPNGTNNYTYAPLKTTIISPLGTKVLEYNKAGQLIKSTENGKSVTFTYTPAGQIASSTALSSSGNLTTTMSYDIAGNRISMTDPDVGTIQNKYDAYGREIYMKTEIGREINSYYDSKGRLTSVEDGDNNTYYTYNDNNQLVKESCNSYNCTYTYDGFNRVTSKMEKVDGTEFKTQYTYPNNYDGVSKITYPSGLVVTNTYNKGYLNSVTCGGKTIWSGLKLDTYGRPTEETLAGGIMKKYGYNSKNQLSQETAYKNSTGLMDLSYTYTDINITKKADALEGNTEQYTYDNLNRLVGVTTSHSSSTLSGTTTYDGLGNMKTTWDKYWNAINYGENNLAPHQVSSVSYQNSSVSTGIPKVTYDSYRMPTRIEQGNYALDIEYRPDHRRCLTKSYKSGNISSRKYFLTDYEKEVNTLGTNREIHYLYGGNGLAAIYTRTNGKDTLFAAVTDRQNSLTAVMDVATDKVEKFAYKPWGMRRNPTNWSENVVKDYPARFSRGYCMHEHLPELGLINMGGRVYNARTNQFLSPDPYRQAPDSWLNCNRFGYCMGNPVMYTDPDGEVILTSTAIAIICSAVIGGLINCGIKSYNGQINSMGDALAAFGWGALAGAATGGICVCADVVAAGTAAASSVGYAMGTGVIAGATNSIIMGIGENVSFGGEFASIGDVLKGAALGAIAGGAMRAVSNLLAGKNVWTGQGRTPDTELAPQKALTEPKPEELGSGRSLPEGKYASKYTVKGSNERISFGLVENEQRIIEVETSRPTGELIATAQSNTDMYHSWAKVDGMVDMVYDNATTVYLQPSGGFMYVAEGSMKYTCEAEEVFGYYTMGVNSLGQVYHSCFYKTPQFLKSFKPYR